MIWKKGIGQPAMARRVLNSAFEYIYIFSNEATRAIGKKDFRGTIANIFELSSNAGKQYADIHKATFRVELPEMFINWFVETSVYEPFAGTGTTLIACEKHKKNCFSMELDPRYCDVIIKRWQDFTGKQATLESTGETYGSNT
jgi:DNA modification methylase